MKRRTAARAAAVVLAVSGLATAVPNAWGADTSGAATGTAGQATKRIDYQGFHAQVPADWPVVDLAAAPGTCVRLDVSAVYLGTPSGDQNCPAHLAPGRADGLLIQPAESGRVQGTVVPGQPVAQSVLKDAAAGHQIQAKLGNSGLQVTASYATSADRVRQILETASVDAGARPSAAPSTAKPALAGSAPRTDVAGFAFDRCAAPSDATMSAWAANSPYRAVGVYIGGPSQACASPAKSWVDSRNAEGWGFMPIYVGAQAARGNVLISADVATARQQGSDAANDAIAKANGLGFQAGAVLYNDMENYDSSVYRDRVVSYLAGWTAQLHTKGYRSGVYASASSGVKDLAARYTDSSYPEPDVLWAAAWNSHHDVTDAGMGLTTPGQWTGGRRAHQYSGDVTESYGGVSLGIDANYLDVTSNASGNTLQPGQRLASGQSLTSDSMTLTMQPDGNLVAYLKAGTGSRPVWSTKTYGNSGAYAVMQDDGNLVIYRADGGPGNGGALWATTTASGGAYAMLQDDGNFVVYRKGGGQGNGALWASGSQALSPLVFSGRQLSNNQWTQSATVRMVMQDDGNLVLYRRSDNSVLWTSYTYNNPGAYLFMQPDGNLVIYKAGTTTGALWQSSTYSNPGAYGLLQDDGNFVVYRQGGGPTTGGPLWSTSTYGQG
ncbi:glycoside hydrolase domain-containing protein [Kitasatospora sp. NPDC059673]|uniref:glycoside hydrolase domain-containing protein n=1 Tax=Kitasatospora sp. NPDC059673 TaxID=3346901 RepID=UPI0036CBEC26